MSAPVRVQLSRKKGWHMPANTVKVSRPGKWGNPFYVGGYFLIGDPGMGGPFRMSWCEAMPEHADSRFALIKDGAMAVDFYRRLLASGYRNDFSELHGKNLACWCALNEPCHADVLLELANQ